MQRLMRGLNTSGRARKIEADVALFIENLRLVKMRQGVGTYGYCAWCDAGMSNPTNLWNHYQSVHSVSMQVAPYTPPSVWQTLLGREMGARIEHFAAPSKELKYWVTPAESNDWSTWIEGISRNGPSYLVGVTELNLNVGRTPATSGHSASSLSVGPIPNPTECHGHFNWSNRGLLAEGHYRSVPDLVDRNGDHLGDGVHDNVQRAGSDRWRPHLEDR